MYMCMHVYAHARPHWTFEHFLFLYLQHKFTALFFSTHSTSTAQSAEDGLHCPLQTRHLDLDVVQEDPNIFPFCKVLRPWFFKHWIVLSTGEITTQRKSPRETNCIIHWIENYPMDSVNSTFWTTGARQLTFLTNLETFDQCFKKFPDVLGYYQVLGY